MIVQYNYILFTNKLPWPGVNKGSFFVFEHASTSLFVYHVRWRLHTVASVNERRAGMLFITIFIVFGLIRPEIEPSIRRKKNLV